MADYSPSEIVDMVSTYYADNNAREVDRQYRGIQIDDIPIIKQFCV